MEINSHKEEFSYAYVHAIAATAGYACAKADRILDLDGIDLTITAPGIQGTRRRPRIDLQVKCTSRTDIVNPLEIRYPLEVAAYDSLRSDDTTIPCFLVVVLVPDNPEEWLQHSEEALLLRRCGYWKSLVGAPPTTNKTTITVRVERTNILTPQALKDCMERLGAGGAI